MAKRSEWVYDALLSYLGDAFFQVPVVTFMEDRCIIFGQDSTADKEFREVHKDYISVVTKLLECFMKDLGLNYEEVIGALKEMNKKKDLRDVFQVIFDQVLYLEDFDMFKNAMIAKNIELEEQALLYVLKQTGRLPESFQKDAESTNKAQSKPPSGSSISKAKNTPPAIVMTTQDETFQKILQEPEQQSEAATKKKEATVAAAVAATVDVEAELYRVQEMKIRQEEQVTVQPDLVVIPAAGAAVAKASQTAATQKASVSQTTAKGNVASVSQAPAKGNVASVSQATAKADVASKPSVPMSMTDMKSAPAIALTPAAIPAGAAAVAAKSPPAAAVPGATKGRPPAQPPLSAAPVPGVAPLPAVSKKNQLSGSEAAANWLKSAQNESENAPSPAVMAAAAKYSNLDPEELKKRQQFFVEQRKKLLEKKKQEREKQLLSAEKAHPQRPMSARAAKAALKEQPTQIKKSPEDEKTIAMRRALYDRLKAEVIENK